MPNAVGGTYYILAHSVSGAAATAGYTLTVSQTTVLSISAISPGAGGEGDGPVTIEIDGANFTPSTTASLTLGAATYDATATYFASASQIFATFYLTGNTGNYTLQVQQGAQSAAAPASFQVVNSLNFNSNMPLVATVGAPQVVRSGRTASIVINYSNETDHDLAAPLLDISSANPNVLFSTPDDPNDFVSQAQVLAVAPSGPAGVLRSGQSGSITLTLLSNDPIDDDEIPVVVNEIKPISPLVGFDGEDNTPPIDWLTQEAALQPPSIPTAAWDVIFPALVARLRGPDGESTEGSYNQASAGAASYLSGLGETAAQVSDVGRLWSFLVAQADAAFPSAPLASTIDASLPTPGSVPLAIDRTFGSSISSRYTTGIFGLGWSTSWQTSLTTDAAGNVTINSGGSLMTFSAQPNGAYLDTDGEHGTLTASGGVFTYTDSSGTQHVFLANGNLNYRQDCDGNRVTLGYNASNQLVSLTYSNANDAGEPTEQLTLAYNAQGFVSQVSDGTGNTWVYQFDSSGRLLSVTAPGNLSTSYAYDTGTNPETANALLSITNSDGSQQNFTYDAATGRLTGTNANGGADAITHAYLGQGEVSATDSAHNQTIVWFNDIGAAARVQDPNGAVASSLFDNNGDLIGHTNAAGASYQYAYNQNGDLTRIVNPLGQTVKLNYGSLDTLTSYTDASGNTTQQSYSSTGDLLSIAYPDGTSQSFSYDPLGDMTDTVLQNGDAVGYQYTAQGLVSKESFADGTSQTFAYDSHGNLLTAETFDASGTLTGTTTLTYNGANELLTINYPSGLSLTFTYNAAGQRVKSVDQSGFTVQYSYDIQGRLEKLEDGAGNLIVQYTYNNLGQLQSKQNGNGTSTVYGHDPAGNLTSIVNYAADGTTVNSSFTYTYNLLDEVTSMVSAAGTTTYGYDVTGQLTSVGLPNGTSLTYVYNAAGDRTEVVTNGTPTNDTSNNVNEITSVGAATYSYDKNGNLHTVSDSGGTTTYNYNDLNELLSITAPDGSVTAFQYSPLGFLVGTSTTPAGGSTSQTNYLVDPAGLGNMVGAYTGGGSLIADYTYGLGLVSQTGPSGSGYYDFDLTDNTAGITGAGGSYLNQYSYLPFGETTTIGTPQLPNPFTFGGQFGVMQVGANLFDMRAREYTPATGQFLSNDPLGLAGGDANIRRFTGNAPTISLDPLGLEDTVVGPTGENTFFLNGDVYKVTNQSQQVLADLQARTFRTGELFRRFNESGRRLSAQRLQRNIDAALANSAKFAKYAKFLRIAGYVGLGLTAIEAAPHVVGLIQHPPTFHPENLGNFLQALVKNLLPHDPNALIGPGGYGTQNFIQPTGTLPYTVDFENDGSVAAQDVTVTEQLDPNLDWSTFQLGSFGFGPIKVSVPPGLTEYQTTVAYQNVDGSSLNVVVALDFNEQTGLLTATFTSLDPATGQPPSGVTDGFLPPDNASGIGEGYVQYTVDPKSGLATGATVSASASVAFDTNAPLSTKTVTNTIDAGAPTSSVTTLPATEASTSFTVSWSGADDAGGSGIATYSVFVSDNGGPFTAFQTNTTATSATFTGVNGHTYGFYSVATDNVGNVQPAPAAAQATTAVFVLNEDVYVIGSGTITVSAANGVLENDAGPSQLTVTSTIVMGAEGGTFTFHSDGSFTYAPPANFPGFDYASYTAQDAAGDTGTATVNVLSQTGGIVWKFYEQVLHRNPDDVGLQGWIQDFANGGTPGDIATGFFESTELLNQIITGYYWQYLGRGPMGNDLPGWESFWRQHGGPEGIQAGFADSPEFNSLAGNPTGANPAGWITALYQRILNRPPEPGAVPFWELQLATGTSENQIALEFFTSLEAYNNDVTGWYYEYLGRAPTLSEQARYANQMLAGASDRDIEQAITNLPEYSASPPASPAGAGARLPNYLPASIAATDAVFGNYP